MPKTCQHPGCSYNVWGKGFCKFHQSQRTDKKDKPPKPKVVYRIPKMSKRLASDNAKYLRMLPAWKEGKTCCYPGCERPAEHCHHSKGRGVYLLEVSTWRPMCAEHHDIAENNANEAKRLNISVSRLTTLEKDLELFEDGFYQ